MTFSILDRYTSAVLYSGEHKTLKEAVEAAVKARADLRSANLQFANLRSADLRSADLQFADLRSANLRSADLQFADLRSANLRSAKINWNSHDLISELLLRAAGQSVGRREVAGLIRVSPDWCWKKWLTLRNRRRFAWAIDVLAAHVQDGDGAPDLLRDRAAELAKLASSPSASDSETQPAD